MNFTILQPPVKVFSMKCSLPTDLQKFSPSKVPRYTVVAIINFSENSLRFFLIVYTEKACLA